MSYPASLLLTVAIALAFPAPASAFFKGRSHGHSTSSHKSSSHKSSSHKSSSHRKSGDVRVRGYTRKNGTYVRPHMRSRSDGNFSNNWSSKGNVNPYTGEIGTKTKPSGNFSPSSSRGGSSRSTESNPITALPSARDRIRNDSWVPTLRPQTGLASHVGSDDVSSSALGDPPGHEVADMELKNNAAIAHEHGVTDDWDGWRGVRSRPRTGLVSLVGADEFGDDTNPTKTMDAVIESPDVMAIHAEARDRAATARDRGIMKGFVPWLVGVAVLFLWCFVSWILAAIGGWRRLAEHYMTLSPAEGEVFRMASASVGQVNYGCCLTIALSRFGLRLAVWPMFRIGHPPLLIPWSEFHDIRERQTFFIGHDEVSVGNPAVATFRFRPHILQTAKELGYLKPDVRRREQAHTEFGSE